MLLTHWQAVSVQHCKDAQPLHMMFECMLASNVDFDSVESQFSLIIVVVLKFTQDGAVLVVE